MLGDRPVSAILLITFVALWLVAQAAVFTISQQYPHVITETFNGTP